MELAQGQEPCVVVRRASGPVRVAAVRRHGGWVFAWGRGRDHWGPALDGETPHRIRAAAW
ncbi:hypothetical protein [Streptosporangium carneum]|uniref:hypothetical protein n=1 Tax=Streptosporangium carneum TaxID=47481 RepID=UPI0022F316B5|nr:hypothetical protein [Streptosporangium carneum]